MNGEKVVLDFVNLFSHLVRVGTYANYGQISCFNFSSISVLICLDVDANSD